MARTPQRRGERKLIQVSSVWTDGSNDVTVVSVQTYGEYRYITYRYTHKRKPEPQPLDELTFALRYDAKVVRKDEVKVLAKVASSPTDDGKIKHVGWAG